MLLSLSLTTLVPLITPITLRSGFFSLLGFNSFNIIYIHKYCYGYLPHKVYRDRWYTNHQLLHDGRDVINA